MKYTPGARRLSALHKEHQKRQKPVHLTQDGFLKLQQEHDALIAERPLAVENLKKARELGDLSENGYYKASRAKLSQIDSRLLHVKHLLKTAQIIEQATSDMVILGSTVVIRGDDGEKTYMIVGRHEANPSQGKISDVSPIGRALLGKVLGSQVTFQVPSGEKSYTIVKILT